MESALILSDPNTLPHIVDAATRNAEPVQAETPERCVLCGEQIDVAEPSCRGCTADLQAEEAAVYAAECR